MIAVITSDQHHNLMHDPYDLKDHKERALRQALEATLKADIGIDAGDLFDRRNPDSETLNWVTRIYYDVLGHDIYRMYFLNGNHDSQNRMTAPIEAFVNGCKCYECYGRPPIIVGKEIAVTEYTAGNNLAMRGWQSNDNIELPVYIRYFITHARIAEWCFGNTERAFAKLQFEAMNVYHVFCGDNHQIRDEGKLVSIGCLCPASFADKDVQAGLIVLDTDHNEYKRINIEGYPIFREIVIIEGTGFEPRPEYVKGNIIKFKRIGSHKFVNDKIDISKWNSLVWSMHPHFVSELPSFEITKPETILAQGADLLPVEEEIKQMAEAQDWEGQQEGSLNAALGC